MDIELDPRDVVLGEHRYGRFDRRMPIGPVQWSFHDLLWIHEGQARVQFPHLGKTVDLVAPAGVLILPDTPFSGRAVGAYATASICHFSVPGMMSSAFAKPGYLVPREGETLHLQNQIRLALHLARTDPEAKSPRRQRLLRAIVDGFHLQQANAQPSRFREADRLAVAWDLAARELSKVRTLSDVAQTLSIKESALRTLHRKTWRTSAGEHLRELRLQKAEELLATTGFSLVEIARQVGYAHAETFIAAFKKSRGKTPGQYRHWSNPFA